MQLTAVEAQVLTVPKLNSTLGNTSVINTCNAGTVTFTVTGDTGPNALGVGIGLAVENFDFGVQFNAPLRKINQVYAPSVFELYFSFDFSPFRRNNRGVYKRLQIDNY